MVKKHQYKSGKVVWFYEFDAPGSTRANRVRIREFGFPTRTEALAAEEARRADERRKAAALAAGASFTDLPKTLRALLDDFFTDSEPRLAPTTLDGYRRKATLLSPEILDLPIAQITPLHLDREWRRLLDSGGRHRKTKAARPLSAKTVRHVAGVVSSALARAVKWRLIPSNPASESEPPVPQEHMAAALTPQQVELLIAAATPWPMATFLTIAAATGARRGELLALRWSDIQEGHILVARAMSQVQGDLFLGKTKNRKSRAIVLPPSAVAALEKHRAEQNAFRKQFGPDYQPGDLVFCRPDGSPLKPDSVSSAISALFTRLRLPKPKGAALHLLRHTHTSQLLAAGADLTAVSKRLGHSSPLMTAKVYAHVIPGRDREAAERWERFQVESKEQQKGKVQ